MHRSPLLFVAAFYGLLNTGLAAPAEIEECLVGSYVVFEVQPYQVVCGGVTSTSQVTKTYTLPFDPEATDPGTSDEPGLPGQPDAPGSPSSTPTVTVTRGCDGGDCAPQTIEPEPGCTKCTVTVITPVPETTSPPIATPTITAGCPDPDDCKPTTIFPPTDCTKACTVTVITTPPPGSGVPVATTTLTDPPDGPPTTVTTTVGCADPDNCTPGTFPPASGCTETCTATVITTPPSSSEVPQTTSEELSTTSEEPSSTSSVEPSSTSETPGPTFDCDAGGYLIQVTELYRLDLTTGENVLVNSAVGPGEQVNAIGYNVQDDYIWGIVQGPQLIRINQDGDYTLFDVDLGDALYWNVGDFDQDGTLWVLNGSGEGWARIDATTGSDTIGEVVESGDTTQVNGVSDWALVKGGGNYLYTIARSSTTNAVLQRWSLDTKEWEVLEELGDIAGNNIFGAVYSAGNGVLYASENNSGEIWRFDVLGGDVSPTLVTEGPSSTNNDGARCIEAPDPETTAE